MVWQFFWALGFPQWLSSKESTCSAGPMEAKTWVQFLGQEDPLEKELATHSSLLSLCLPFLFSKFTALVYM